VLAGGGSRASKVLTARDDGDEAARRRNGTEVNGEPRARVLLALDAAGPGSVGGRFDCPRVKVGRIHGPGLGRVDARHAACVFAPASLLPFLTAARGHAGFVYDRHQRGPVDVGFKVLAAAIRSGFVWGGLLGGDRDWMCGDVCQGLEMALEDEGKISSRVAEKSPTDREANEGLGRSWIGPHHRRLIS